MERLFPDSGPIGLDAYEGLDLVGRALPDRPYTVANFVATVDGQSRLDGDTDDLGNEADKALFVSLRGQADCIMAGTSTIGIEQYGPIGRDPVRRELRHARGLRQPPLFCTVTRSGKLPVSAPLFKAPDSELVVFSGVDLDLSDVSAQVTVERSTDPAQVVRTLKTKHQVNALLIEGGPSLLTAFIEQGVVDELFLTLHPALAGAGPMGELFPIISGALKPRRALKLLSVLKDEDFLFLRYRLKTAPEPDTGRVIGG